MRPILPAAAMRAAEQAAIAAGTSNDELIEQAGAALASAVRRFVGPRETLVLCGPGNNGTDGRVAARHLAEAGYDVRIATIDEVGEAKPAPLLVDCLFEPVLTVGWKKLFRSGFSSLALRHTSPSPAICQVAFRATMGHYCRPLPAPILPSPSARLSQRIA
jgi:hypothetical protein